MRYFLPLMALVCCSLVACEDTVSPILETDRQFTIYGTLDMDRDTQYVRVIPIRPNLIATTDDPNAQVRSIELSTQNVVEWRDSVHTFANGTVGYIYYALLRIRAGETYRLEVKPIDGELVTSAETTVPEQPTVTVYPESLERIFTTRLVVRQRVVLEGLKQAPFDVEQWYRFLRLSDFTYMDVQLSYDPLSRPVPNDPSLWEIDMDLVRDKDSLTANMPVGPGLPLAGLGLRITVLDDDFVPPDNSFDPELLAQPGTLSNVDNGFGFFASVGRFSVEWLLADTTIVSLGFTPLGSMEGPRLVGKDLPRTFGVANQ